MTGPPIRVLIADDEPLAREGLRTLVTARPGFLVVADVASGLAAVEAVRSLRPDVLLLDVRMPQLDGLEVIRRLGPDRPPVVILVTAFDEHAVEAFELDAVDYLLKPVSDRRLDDALARARRALTAGDYEAMSRKVDALLQRMDPGSFREPPRPARILVKSAGRTVVVDVDTIDWIEGASYYARIHSEGRSHLLRRSLQSLAEELDPTRFMQTHRSAIVNLDRVVEIQVASRGVLQVVLRGGIRVPLSRDRKDALEAYLAHRG